MQARVFAAFAAGTLGAAFLVAVAAHAASPADGPGRPVSQERAEGPPARAPSAEGGASGAAAPSTRPAAPPTSRRPRVPAGVLARAASRRAEEREEASPARERRRARGEGNIISIEIDWNAGAAAR